MKPVAPGSSWRGEIAARWKTEFFFKLFGISGFMTVFFVCYFALLEHPSRPGELMPLTALDYHIGFYPGALPLYLSLWFYVSIFPGVLTTKRQLLIYGAGAAVLALAGFFFFYFWPTAVPPPGIDLGAHPQFASLKEIDATGNACPSLHVAFALFTALWAETFFREIKAPAWLRWLNALWCVAIIYSTLATKQHVALDVYGGIALGVIGTALHIRLTRRWVLP